jgi:hypothetical protein
MVDASVPGPSSGAPDATHSAAEGCPGNLGRGSGLPLVAQARRRKTRPGMRCGRCHRSFSVADLVNLKSLQRPQGSWWVRRRKPDRPDDSYLVDSASSHMLVSKIKPCMSKYKQLYRETANGSLYKLSFI